MMSDPIGNNRPTCREPTAADRGYGSASAFLEGLAQDPQERLADSIYGGGPFAYDLEVLNETEWACADRFISGLDGPTREDLGRLRADLHRANANGDRWLTRQEV